jgi:CheY-like chemotaxis protein
VVAELSPLAETHGVELRLDTEGITSQRVLAVGHRLEQVLRNLLSNSLKFTRAGGLATLRVSSMESDHILFEVTDTGVGISEVGLKTILEPFRQAEGGTGGGTGLGLPISSRLLEAMSSELKIQSRLGEGSSFSFSLPVATPASPNGETTRAPGPALSEVRAGETTPTPLQVLLVDDNNEAREVISGLLEQLSCEVETARDGVEALEIVSIRQPEVLLLDIQMPRLGGVETAEELRRRFSAGEFPPFKMIAVTGNADTQNSLSRDGLFDQVIAKPVGLAELEAGLLQVISK